MLWLHLLLLLGYQGVAEGSLLASVVTARPYSENGRPNASAVLLEKRVTTVLSTCGFLNGDPQKPRTANSGFVCRIDTAHGIYGFCPSTVIAATDCGLGGACQDKHSCSTGCGITNNPSITTWTCTDTKQDFCSTALLTIGVDQTYTFLQCAAAAITDNYLISPTAELVTSSSSSTSISSLVASTSAIPTVSALTSQTTSGFPASTGATSTASADKNAASGTTNNTGAIIGGVIGGLALLCGFGIAAIYLLRRDRRRKPVAPRRETTPENTIPKEHKIQQGGWGPSELPVDVYGYPARPQEPVELPVTYDR